LPDAIFDLKLTDIPKELLASANMSATILWIITNAVWPWLLTMLCFLGVVSYVPELSLWLPRQLGMLY
jgi:TRAP-type C4-dicarboxylate transport system permease large subunit